MKTKPSRAELQRYECLKLAFDTIDIFATPSLSPDLYESFEALQEILLNIYKPKEENNEQN